MLNPALNKLRPTGRPGVRNTRNSEIRNSIAVAALSTRSVQPSRWTEAASSVKRSSSMQKKNAAPPRMFRLPGSLAAGSPSGLNARTPNHRNQAAESRLAASRRGSSTVLPYPGKSSSSP